MKKFIHLKPVAGRLTRDPVTMVPLPAEGAWVERTEFFVRRIVAGDVTLVAEADTMPEDRPASSVPSSVAPVAPKSVAPSKKTESGKPGKPQIDTASNGTQGDGK